MTSTAFSNISIFISHNNTLTSISKEDLTDLFLKKISSVNGIQLTPIDSSDKRLYREFYQKVLEKEPSQIHAYWVKEIFKGDKQPPKKLSKQEIKKAIKNNSNKNIIAYADIPLTGKIILTVK